MIRQIDDKDVFETYLKVSWRTSSTRFGERILAASKKKHIQAWAYNQLLREYTWELAYACNKEVSDEDFVQKLKNVEQFWMRGLTEFGNVPVNNSDRTISDQTKSLIKINSKNAWRNHSDGGLSASRDKARVRKVVGLIEKIIEEN